MSLTSDNMDAPIVEPVATPTAAAASIPDVTPTPPPAAAEQTIQPEPTPTPVLTPPAVESAPIVESTPSPPPSSVVVSAPPVVITAATTSSSASAARLAAVRSQITSACHTTEPVDGGDGNVFVHVIDGAGQFSCTPNDLTYLVLHASTRPSSYSVVGIMGCQSTGKSTLLNLLFGTKFQMMDSSLGRSQTTKGVWMDSGSKRRDLVIMDLEGTDSGERGEDRTTFERQTSLYALAVAEVLLINMWEHDIGRYTASNYGILKTVFEVNLQLFDSQNKTILLFVIRDHIEEDTPFDAIIIKLQTEVSKIWSEIRKPDKFSNTPVEELFELRFFALPHMKLQKKVFGEKVDELRQQFIDSNDSNFLFGSSSHGTKTVPADGFGVYMEQCWTSIQKNKELNLPTQKEMLATFRCDEIIQQLTIDVFQPIFQSLKDRSMTMLLGDEFMKEVNPLLTLILYEYSQATQHYHGEIVSVKRLEFLRKLSKDLEDLYAQQSRKFISTEMIERIKRELKGRLATPTPAANGASKVAPSLDAPHPDFLSIAASARSVGLDYAGGELAKFNLEILSNPEASNLPPESLRVLLASWTTLTKKIEEELSQTIDSTIAVERASQLKKLSFHLDKVFKTQLSVPLNTLLKRAHPVTMWYEVGKLYRNIYGSVIQQYVLETLLPNYEPTSEERNTLESQSEKQLAQLIRLIVDQHAAMIGVYMRSKFDKLFRSDSNGRIRTWTSGENIRKLFKHARDEALKQLDLFAVFRLDEYKDADSPANKAVLESDDLPAQKARRPSVKRVTSIPTSPVSPGSSESEEEKQESPEEEEEKIGQTTIDYSQVDAANIILDPTQRLEKESTFRFEIEGALREAEIAQAQNETNAKVPLWMIGLVCFLGMDEIMTVLRNPLLLFLIVVVGGGAYMAHQVGALMPMIGVAKATAWQLIAQAQSNLQPPVPASGSSSSSNPGVTVRRPSSIAPPHHRNLSLSKSYTEPEREPPTSTSHSRIPSMSSGDMLPSTLRVQDTVELQDLTPHNEDATVTDFELKKRTNVTRNE